MKHLKLFNNHNDYSTDITTAELPNVSYCIVQDEVHYNPWIDPILIVKYNVVNDSNPTMLYFYISDGGITVNGAAMFDKVELDGTEMSITDLDTASGQYQLSEGEHTARYKLKDPTFIGIEMDMSTQQMNIGATFMQCNAISEVNIPNTVTTINNFAFSYCGRLTNITIPSSVTTIGQEAFCACSGLTSIIIPDSVTTIGNNAFGYCDRLTSITIGNNVTTIGEYAFQRCISLTSVTIPDSVTSIGNWAFSGCTSLTNITIPNSVTSIGNHVFYNCQNLESITFEDVTKITFNDESGDFIFGDCPKLESINITADTPWTFMPYRGFMRCYALKSIVIPNTVTNIKGMALCNCTSLTTITIPAGVTTIGMQAFDGCTSLTSITCLPTTPPTLNNNDQFKSTNNCPIYVPAESVAAYKAASGWSTYASRIQAIPTE